MRYLDRIRTEPSLWLLILIAGGVVATLLYVALTSITYQAGPYLGAAKSSRFPPIVRDAGRGVAR